MSSRFDMVAMRVKKDANKDYVKSERKQKEDDAGEPTHSPRTAKQKTKNSKDAKERPRWGLNPQPFDYWSNALPFELQGL